jgi:hypothetical protein
MLANKLDRKEYFIYALYGLSEEEIAVVERKI